MNFSWLDLIETRFWFGLLVSQARSQVERHLQKKTNVVDQRHRKCFSVTIFFRKIAAVKLRISDMYICSEDAMATMEDIYKRRMISEELENRIWKIWWWFFLLLLALRKRFLTGTTPSKNSKPCGVYTAEKIH